MTTTNPVIPERILDGSSCTQPGAAAMSTSEIPPALAARCAEVLNWHRTGVLKGEALRTMSKAQPGDHLDALRSAEERTALEAMEFVVAFGELVERELAVNALGKVA